MVSTTDIVILTLSCVLVGVYFFKDAILEGAPGKKSSTSALANGATPAAVNGLALGKKGGYQGDPRDFVERMKHGVSSVLLPPFYSFLGLVVCRLVLLPKKRCHAWWCVGEGGSPRN
jgi:hypothetical protein